MISNTLTVGLRFAPLGLLLLFAVLLVKALLGEATSGAKTTGKNQPTTFYLVAKNNPGPAGETAGKRYLLGEKTYIGRDGINDLAFNDPYLSGRHALVSLRGEELWLEDLHSTNGVRLNGKLITTKTQIYPEDRITVGQMLLAVERDEESAYGSYKSRRVGKATK